MTSTGDEVEVKFYVQRLPTLASRLLDLGARLLKPRAHELNLRFDTNDRALELAHRALRLRRDAAVTLTYKGTSTFRDGIRIRREIELAIDDFNRGRQLLEGLGYVVVFTYEKYRATYKLDETEIMLDELPYGQFVEIEGEMDSLKGIAAHLGLRWEAAVAESYLGLFDKVRRSMNLPFSDLTFENFGGRVVQPDHLGVVPADGD